MVSFGVDIDKESLKLIRYIKRTNRNLRADDVLNNPFTGFILNAGDFLAVYINPIYFNLPKYVVVFMLGIAYITKYTPGWYLAFIGLFGLLNIFWFSGFYYLIFKLGLKRAGYKGTIKYISPANTLERLILWDKEKF